MSKPRYFNCNFEKKVDIVLLSIKKLCPILRNTTRMVVTALVCFSFGLYGQTTAPHMQVDNSVQVPPRRPLLINKQDTALCLAPNGSLWAWGGNEIGLMGVF